ncbi:MAG: integral rane sensor signal transduction histidine kinase [Ilumatobacteraceae bacterium]|nr:integral rane sensor signal transduction histidine kinase [Ilumatobacteraceae bacterium]
MPWLASTSIVFPIAALVVSVLSFLTTTPTLLIALLFAAALVPWALVAGGIRVPALVVVAVTLGATAWLAVPLGDQAAMFLPIAAASWAAALGLRWPSIAAVAGAFAIAIGYQVANETGRANWVIWATGTLFGWFAGALLHRQRLLTDALDVAHHELAVAAADNERKAIAREVHDVVGHSLTVVLLNIAGARRHLATNPAAADEALAQAETVGRDSLDTVRAVVGLLHSSTESQRDAPLPDGRQVAPLIEQVRRAGLQVDLQMTGDPATLEPTVGLTLVRVLQESLANASRHAPGAPIAVEMLVDPAFVRAAVANPLPSAPPRTPPAGVGLSSMSARVAALNGTIDAGPHDGRWVVRWQLPRPGHTTMDTTTVMTATTPTTATSSPTTATAPADVASGVARP